ncbi:cytochrome c oxidase assembly protein [Skermania sp. ID1734]|uniref:cytochrome c oxidase assembly protein n=1 Tax=Skermania sp. ID1734 TaxID=2597516 RepID=UPI00117D0A33|nr:cytochrome c oxidase assembly protein [Skermania sp. ID1734]TSD94438.1 cytochrome c oxidase assembly protein [Skermania sp. ID1734]
MALVTDPLTLSAVLTAWRFEPTTAVAVVGVGAAYALGVVRRARTVPWIRVTVFAFGLLCWFYAGSGFLGVYSDTLFWVRALQVLLLLSLAPLCLAFGKPLTVLRDALDEPARARMDALLDTGFARGLVHPITTSAAMLLTPWLLYMTGWYRTLLENGVVDAVTRLLLVVIGFGYYYARLQADPVPHRYSQAISLIITTVETLGDGILGVVLWQGSVLIASYYAGRGWGPSPRTDQTIGAGILWILGDVIGLPLLLMLLQAFSSDERRKEVVVDQELDEEFDAAPASGLWWENDPQLRDRFRR